MDLQISVFLLFILFTAGHSFSCYECTGLNGSCAEQTVKTCPSGSSKCISLTAITQAETSSKMKAKGCSRTCQKGGSMNFGISIRTSFCCDTDLCNVQDPPDHSNDPNGKKCYTIDLQNRTTILSCSGTEDRCIKATGTLGDQSVFAKGCASKSICDATTPFPSVSISCCEGNLCNGAQSVSQSFLFFCCSLLSYFLLH
ncbi:urokinase plasminogen activator surface receptor-like [Ctenopharyngodon idella]|uniref:urokinase plasminogen activator surface receptor-like n=1 Tax=Ctenopharyngodon idella TaxID=7959 RepID=UPI00223094E9|nr:urokinase plasminogen activator surface receptor-like [Ctenopharyngodon idella]